MKKYCILIAAYCIVLLPLFTKAQSTKPAEISISGEVTTPFTLNTADLSKLPQKSVVRKDKDGKDHTYQGVLLAEILKKAGATMGAELKGKNLAKYLLVGAADGYQVVFALTELDSEYTDRMIILTDNVDGKPLPATEGPFRVIVQDEKKPARCARQVISLKVLSAK